MKAVRECPPGIALKDDMQVNAKMIYCAIIRPELEAAGEKIIDRVSLPEELHLRPELLRHELQKALDQESGHGTVLLGFGLCGMAAVGLSSGESRLVIPRVDD